MANKSLTEAINFQMSLIPSLQKMTPDLRWCLAEHSVAKQFKKGDFIWQRQDKGDYCVLILEGLVEISSLTSTGEERIIGIFGPGEIVGISALLKDKSFPANAVVSSKTARVFKLFIRGLELENHLRPELQMEIQNWLREMLLTHEQILRDKIMITGAGDIQHKLTELFEHLRSRFAPKQDENNFFIEVPMTKTQMAKMIEARVETVIRTLNKWERAGYLEMTTQGPRLSNFKQLKALEKMD